MACSWVSFFPSVICMFRSACRDCVVKCVAGEPRGEQVCRGCLAGGTRVCSSVGLFPVQPNITEGTVKCRTRVNCPSETVYFVYIALCIEHLLAELVTRFLLLCSFFPAWVWAISHEGTDIMASNSDLQEALALAWRRWTCLLHGAGQCLKPCQVSCR